MRVETKERLFSRDTTRPTAERVVCCVDKHQDFTAQGERPIRLLSSGFANKAPANVVQKERDKPADFRARAEKLKEQIERLG